jgi:putative transposase
VKQPGGTKADAGRRYRAYPTPEQAGRLTGWGHSCRAIWNLALEQRQYLYRHRGLTLRAVEQCAQLTQARGELPWLTDLPAQSAQQVLRQLDRAYDYWWNPQHPADAPTFKKRSNRLAVPFPGQAIKIHKLNRKWAQVRLPKVGWMRFRRSRPLGGVVRNATGRKVSTFVRQVDQGFVVLTASCVGWLIQAMVGSFGGAGGLRTNRSGWAA